LRRCLNPALLRPQGEVAAGSPEGPNVYTNRGLVSRNAPHPVTFSQRAGVWYIHGDGIPRGRRYTSASCLRGLGPDLFSGCAGGFLLERVSLAEGCR
jgi:hypothetical protein